MGSTGSAPPPPPPPFLSSSYPPTPGVETFSHTTGLSTPGPPLLFDFNEEWALRYLLEAYSWLASTPERQEVKWMSFFMAF